MHVWYPYRDTHKHTHAWNVKHCLHVSASTAEVTGVFVVNRSPCCLLFLR